jgi:hypothetical protein
MKKRLAFVHVLVLAATASVSAQPAVDPEPLRLPIGAKVRLRTQTAPHSWVKGYLASASASSIAFVPEGAPPLGASEMRLPTESVTRLELSTGHKRHWLVGLAAGVVIGTALGFTLDEDPVACKYDDNYSCSRGEAVAASAFGFGLVGTGIGALVKTDRWTPVALDALGPAAPRASGLAPRLRVLPHGGLELGVALGF